MTNLFNVFDFEGDRVRNSKIPIKYNFPYSFDQEILGTKPKSQKNGYNIYQKAGSMNDKDGVFEIGVKK